MDNNNKECDSLESLDTPGAADVDDEDSMDSINEHLANKGALLH